jgi:hypothetical protein
VVDFGGKTDGRNRATSSRPLALDGGIKGTGIVPREANQYRAAIFRVDDFINHCLGLSQFTLGDTQGSGKSSAPGASQWRAWDKGIRRRGNGANGKESELHNVDKAISYLSIDGSICEETDLWVDGNS